MDLFQSFGIQVKKEGGEVVQSEQEEALPDFRGTIRTSQQMQFFFWRRHTLIYSGLFAPQPLKLCRIITSGCLAKSCLNANQLHLKFEQTNQTSQRNVLGTGKLEKLWWKKKSIKSLKVKLKILLISS